jgi:hypothetical protein
MAPMISPEGQDAIRANNAQYLETGLSNASQALENQGQGTINKFGELLDYVNKGAATYDTQNDIIQNIENAPAQKLSQEFLQNVVTDLKDNAVGMYEAAKQAAPFAMGLSDPGGIVLKAAGNIGEASLKSLLGEDSPMALLMEKENKKFDRNPGAIIADIFTEKGIKQASSTAKEMAQGQLQAAEDLLHPMDPEKGWFKKPVTNALTGMMILGAVSAPVVAIKGVKARSAVNNASSVWDEVKKIPEFEEGTTKGEAVKNQIYLMETMGEGGAVAKFEPMVKANEIKQQTQWVTFADLDGNTSKLYIEKAKEISKELKKNASNPDNPFRQDAQKLLDNINASIEERKVNLESLRAADNDILSNRLAMKQVEEYTQLSSNHGPIYKALNSVMGLDHVLNKQWQGATGKVYKLAKEKGYDPKKLVDELGQSIDSTVKYVRGTDSKTIIESNIDGLIKAKETARDPRAQTWLDTQIRRFIDRDWNTPDSFTKLTRDYRNEAESTRALKKQMFEQLSRHEPVERRRLYDAITKDGGVDYLMTRLGKGGAVEDSLALSAKSIRESVDLLGRNLVDMVDATGKPLLDRKIYEKNRGKYLTREYLEKIFDFQTPEVVDGLFGRSKGYAQKETGIFKTRAKELRKEDSARIWAYHRYLESMPDKLSRVENLAQGFDIASPKIMKVGEEAAVGPMYTYRPPKGMSKFTVENLSKAGIGFDDLATKGNKELVAMGKGKLKEAEIVAAKQAVASRQKIIRGVNAMVNKSIGSEGRIIGKVDKGTQFLWENEYKNQGFKDTESIALDKEIFVPKGSIAEKLYLDQERRIDPIWKKKSKELGLTEIEDIATAGPDSIGRMRNAIFHNDFFKQVENWKDDNGLKLAVSDEPVPGWVLVDNPRFGTWNGKYIHPAVYGETKDIFHILDKKGLSDQGLKAYGEGLRKVSDESRSGTFDNWMSNIENFNTAWRGMKLFWLPSTYVRNYGFNFLLIDAYGISPFTPEGMRKIAQGHKSFLAKDSLYELHLKHGLKRGSFADEHLRFMTQLAEKAEKTGVNGIQTAMSDMNGLKEHLVKFQDKLADIYSNIDLPFMHTVFINELEKGVSPSQAHAIARAAMLDYAKLPEGYRLVRTLYSPFISFPFLASKALAQTAIKNPFTIVKYALIYELANEAIRQSLGESKEEYRSKVNVSQTPGKDTAAIRWPFDLTTRQEFTPDPDKYATVDIRGWIPFLDMFRDSGGGEGMLPNVLAPGHPALNIAYGMATGRDIYFNKTLYRKYESGDEKLRKSAAYIWRTLAPGLAPGGYNWERIASAYGERNEWDYKDGYRMSAMLAIMDTMVGVKVREWSYSKQSEKFRYAWQQQRLEIKKEMKRLLNQYNAKAGQAKTEPAKRDADAWWDEQLTRLNKELENVNNSFNRKLSGEE